MPNAMVVPLAVSGLLALAAALAHRRLPPALATRVTTVALVVVAVSAIPTVWLTAATWLVHAPLVGPWLGTCVEALGAHHSVPLWTGVPALAISTHGIWRAARVVRAHRAVRQHESGVDIVDHDEVFAFTAPGRGGRVVMSSALHDRLSPEERDVVLAHEHAHGRHRHDRHLLTAQLCAALLPPLQPLVRRVQFSIERWADEDAVVACGDRRLVARTLGRVALFSAHEPLVLAFAGLGVPARMTALLAPPVNPPRSVGRVALWLAIAAAAVFAAFQLEHLVHMVLAFCPPR